VAMWKFTHLCFGEYSEVSMECYFCDWKEACRERSLEEGELAESRMEG